MCKQSTTHFKWINGPKGKRKICIFDFGVNNTCNCHSCHTHRGEVMNGGFGLLLDGTEEAAKRASLMLNWDVSNGVRVWRDEQRDSFRLHCSVLKSQIGSNPFLFSAGGSSLLVWKLKRLWDHPAHHGGQQAAACHHALSCAGWARAGPCPAGLTHTANDADTKPGLTYSLL